MDTIDVQSIKPSLSTLGCADPDTSFFYCLCFFLVLIWRFVNLFRFIESCNWLQYRCAPWRLPKEQSNNQLLQTMETATTKGPDILRNQEKDYMFYLFCWSSEHRRNNCWIAKKKRSSYVVSPLGIPWESCSGNVKQYCSWIKETASR